MSHFLPTGEYIWTRKDYIHRTKAYLRRLLLRFWIFTGFIGSLTGLWFLYIVWFSSQSSILWFCLRLAVGFALAFLTGKLIRIGMSGEKALAGGWVEQTWRESHLPESETLVRSVGNGKA